MLVSEATLASRAMRLREAEELVKEIIPRNRAGQGYQTRALLLIDQVAREEKDDSTRYLRANR